MPFNLNQLKTELATDQTGRGYAQHLAVAADAKVAELLNAPTATLVFRNDIRPAEIVQAIPAADFAGLTAVQLAKLQFAFLPGVVDATNANTRSVFLGIFTGLTTTIAALTALAQRPGSRAEILFGTGTVVTSEQVGSAR